MRGGGGGNFLKKWQKMIIAKQVGLCWKSELIFVEEFLREINKSFITGHANRLFLFFELVWPWHRVCEEELLCLCDLSAISKCSDQLEYSETVSIRLEGRVIQISPGGKFWH